MTTETSITLDAQINCLYREIKMREQVYPRLIESRKMTPAKAEFEIEAMRAALKTLENLAANKPFALSGEKY